MANYSRRTLNGHFHDCDNGGTNQARGKAFEDLACYLFQTIPGVEIAIRNQMNAFHNEEIDVAVWNNKASNGLHFLPNVVLIECKNWSNPVSSIEVSWFCQKLQSRGLDFGILIANQGITGNQDDLNAAHNTIANHLMQQRKIIVITRVEIDSLRTTVQMITLIKQKLCLLAVGGRII
ncbi:MULTISPECIES: restriction endonuclease [Sphingobacterium]|uniref:Restriction endonuclease n=1 Tax=Sphingobacterium psychroaquaticum TaxID=561061 RepID=A0A1X7LDQ5_9SPHI|nr:restriction endonuclease [Sphingobacterium psychroaquaticum]SMG51687.1 Restriction endonuclease [Sphingobacterium psychroaquaticum]